MRSIQRDLVLRLLVTVIVLSAASSACLFLYIRSRLTAQFEDGLRTRAQMVGGMVSWEDGKLEFNGPEPEFGGAGGPAAPGYFEIWTPEGAVYARSPSLKERDLPRLEPADRIYLMRVLDLPDARALAQRFVPHVDSGGNGVVKAPPVLTVVVAEDARGLAATLRTIASGMLLAALALAGGSALAVVLMVRRGLKPLHELGSRADAIAATSLHERFATAGLPAELRPIADRLNHLLARLSEAFDRERRFTADVAHELRTPIAELRTLAEVALKWPEDAPVEQNFADALAIARHMEEMVGSLLAIARSEAGRIPVNPAPIDLSQIVLAAWEPHRQQANAKNLAFAEALPANLIVKSDPLLLLPLIGNLFSNSVAHSPAGGQIFCDARETDGFVQFSVRNTSDALAPADLNHIFQPFWRKDSSRTGDSHGGLGLTLVLAYARILGITIKAELTAEEMFRIALGIPAVRGAEAGRVGKPPAALEQGTAPAFAVAPAGPPQK